MEPVTKKTVVEEVPIIIDVQPFDEISDELSVYNQKEAICGANVFLFPNAFLSKLKRYWK